MLWFVATSVSKTADAAAIQHRGARSHPTFSIVLRPIRFELFEKEVQRVLAEFQPRHAVLGRCQWLSSFLLAHFSF